MARKREPGNRCPQREEPESEEDGETERSGRQAQEPEGRAGRGGGDARQLLGVDCAQHPSKWTLSCVRQPSAMW